jgi:inner membrane protein
MDNLTHSLIGAAIGQTGLKKLSGLGMATLIIAANIPDIDAACFLWLQGHEHLAFRRGITHGPIAMLLLPALLTAIMVWFDRWHTARGTRPADRLPVRPKQLFLLALIGCLSHPAFDWLNNYGVRLLEPFSSQWFYGDTLFIIDVWLWAILIGGWFWSRRAENGGGNWRRRGRVVVTVVGLYVLANGMITGMAEGQAMSQWHARMAEDAPGASFADPLIVASPEPFFFWRRRILWRDDWRYGEARYQPGTGVEGLFAEPPQLHGATYPGWLEVMPHLSATNPELRAYLFWSRMPVLRDSGTGSRFGRVITDQRYSDPLSVDRFRIEVSGPLPPSERPSSAPQP